MPMIVGILGLGEVGTALLQCYNDKEVEVHTKDIDGDNFPRLDVLNVCIPYTETFVQTVTKQIIKSRPGLIIIHSTVPPGTTSQIDAASVCCVVHSPVRGSHPNLSKSLMTFTKYIGANTQISATKAEKHYDFLGIPHKTVKNAATTETAKLLCTSYYGVCIAWHDYVADVCESVGVDTNFISEWNNTYNLGYQALDLSKYTTINSKDEYDLLVNQCSSMKNYYKPGEIVTANSTLNINKNNICYRTDGKPMENINEISKKYSECMVCSVIPDSIVKDSNSWKNTKSRS